MTKKGKNIHASARSGPSKRDAVPSILAFPDVSHKEHLDCHIILEDQIIVIDDFLSAEECKRFVKFIDELPLELTPPKKKGEAERLNYRFSVTSRSFAQELHALLLPHLPSFPRPLSLRRRARDDDDNQSRLPHSCNSNIRMYKYIPSQHFGPHYDDSVKEASTGAKSEWTLLIYLTGVQDGVEGGETLFYQGENGQHREAIAVPLTRGTALLHRHGNECLLHEGSLVRKGTKYILRSDLMFMD